MYSFHQFEGSPDERLKFEDHRLLVEGSCRVTDHHHDYRPFTVQALCIECKR